MGKENIKDIKIKDIPQPKVDIILSFNLPPTFNIDKFEEECKIRNLPITVDKESNISGTVFISCSHFDIKNNLIEIREKLKEPIQSVIKNTNFEDEIRRLVIKTKYFNSVIKFLQDKYQEYKNNRVTKEQVEEETYRKYGHLLGREGSKRVSDLFDNDKAKIIINYFRFQEYLIKHFSIEFFIHQQVEKNYFLIIVIKQNGISLLDNPKIKLLEKGTTYEKKTISPPGLKRLNNLYVSDIDKNSIVIIEPIEDDYLFVKQLLSLKNINGAILFMNFLLNKQIEGLKIDMQSMTLDTEKLKMDILGYDLKGIDITINKIGTLADILYNLQDEFISTIIRYCDEVDLEKRGIETETLKNIFSVKRKSGGEEVGIEKFNPPKWLYDYSFVNEFIEFKKSINHTYSQINLLLIKLRELKEYCLEYRHKIEIRQLEKAEKIRLMIFNTVNDVIKIIKTIFRGNT